MSLVNLMLRREIRFAWFVAPTVKLGRTLHAWIA